MTTVEYSEYWEDDEAEEHTCDICGNLTRCCYTANPYTFELDGTLNLEWLCKECYEESVQDI